MEYATGICGEVCDSNYMAYVGYEESNDCIRKYFSLATVRLISRKVTQLLMGVDPANRPIIVPDAHICSVMSNIYYGYRPPTGDIFSRYTIPTGLGPENYVQNMIDQTIEIIVSDIRTTMEVEQNNKKLTAWTTVYGDFNTHGLRQVPPIKVRNRRPAPFQFNMTY